MAHITCGRSPVGIISLITRVCARTFRGSDKPLTGPPIACARFLSLSSCKFRESRNTKTEKALAVQSEGLFDEAAKKAKNKITFRKAVGTFVQKDPRYRRGHVEFIYSALGRMKEFGVEKDLDVYKDLMEILPPYVMIPKNNIQVEFEHYPKQQQCAIDVMQQMEDHGVLPDNAFGDILLTRFGRDAHASRKYRRFMYWIPKFKNLNPYPIPEKLPDDPSQLAAIALKRMAVDWENKVTVHKTGDLGVESSEDTFIAYAQSPKQQELLGKHPVKQPVYVEGGYTVWLRDKLLTYFTLMADSDPDRFKEEDPNDEDLFSWKTMFEEENPREVIPALSLHEQEDGTVLGMCITGTSTKDSLVTWVRYLQVTNPRLEQIPVVFRLRSPDQGLQLLEGEEDSKDMMPL